MIGLALALVAVLETWGLFGDGAEVLAWWLVTCLGNLASAHTSCIG